jgi:zinc protease
MVVTLNAPDKAGIKIPSAEEVKAVLGKAETATISPYKEKVLAKNLLDASRIKAGKIISTKTDEELGTSTLVLSNGATVVLKPTNFKNDEILFRAFSKGGHSLVKDADYYSAIYAASIVGQSGVGGISAIDLGNMLKGKNTSVTPSIGGLSEGLSGGTIPKETETLLQLVYLYFTSPNKEAQAFESFKTRQKQLYANVASNPEIFFSGEVQKIMTSNHPRGGKIPVPGDFDRINLDRSIQIYKERFANAGDFTFIFTGSFNEETLKPLLEKYIGSLPGSPKKENFRDLGIRPPQGKLEKIINKGSEPKSMVNLVFTTPAVFNSNEAYALRSLGELMDIKLVEQLREEKSGVYGVSASGSMNRIPYGNVNFSISFPCAPENADTLTKAALDELKKIIQSGVSKEDLEKIKEQQTRKLEVDIKQNSFWLSGLFDVYFYGSKPADLLKKQQQIDGLTGKMMQDVAKKYLNLQRYIRVTLKPETTEEKKPLKGF